MDSVFCDKKIKIKMDTERYLQPIEVIGFYLENGGKVTNFELINRFKPLLSKTLIGQENHTYLKRKAILESPGGF